MSVRAMRHPNKNKLLPKLIKAYLPDALLKMSERAHEIANSILNTTKFLEMEAKFVSFINDKSQLDAQWRALDFNGNGIVSLAELDKWIVQSFPLLNNKLAILRAFERTTCREGNGDEWIQRREFKALLVNLIYFNRAFELFESIDTGKDRRIDFDEFFSAVGRLGLGLDRKQAQAEFLRIDSNGGGQLLFDEFCEWLVEINSFKFKERMRGKSYVESIANGTSPSSDASKGRVVTKPDLQAQSSIKSPTASLADPASLVSSPSSRMPTQSHSTSSAQFSTPAENHSSHRSTSQAFLGSKQTSPAATIRSRALPSFESPSVASGQSPASPSDSFDQVEEDFVRFISSKEHLITQWSLLDISSQGVVSFSAFQLWLGNHFPLLNDVFALKLAFGRIYDEVGGESAQLQFKDFGAVLVNVLFFCRALSAYKACGLSADQALDLRDFIRVLAVLKLPYNYAEALAQ
jgi:Ca2+-binding EF-hand superfamily protein